MTQENTRDYAIIMLFLQAGLRVSELALLTGTHKVDRGMDVESLRELMGHKRKEATYHYVHLAKSNLRQLQEQTSL